MEWLLLIRMVILSWTCQFKIFNHLLISLNLSDLHRILTEARQRWLRPGEICKILRNHHEFVLNSGPPVMPPGYHWHPSQFNFCHALGWVQLLHLHLISWLCTNYYFFISFRYHGLWLFSFLSEFYYLLENAQFRASCVPFCPVLV